jgi:hypothetical protein
MRPALNFLLLTNPFSMKAFLPVTSFWLRHNVAKNVNDVKISDDVQGIVWERGGGMKGSNKLWYCER